MADASMESKHAEVDKTLFRWCQKHTVELFPFDRDVVVIDATSSHEDAFRILGENNILSAPVYDSGRKKYLGMIDMGDIAHYMVHSFEHSITDKKGSFASLRELITKARSKERATDLVDLSQHDHFKPMPVRSPLLMVCARLAGYPKKLGVHRVPIADPDTHKLIKIISQSAVIGVIHDHLDEFGEGFDRSLDDIGIAHKEVVTVTDEDGALAAFKRMTTLNISAIGVVDTDTGKLIGNISVSDVKVMVRQGRLVTLAQNAMDFIVAVRKTDVAASASGKSSPAVITVHPETSLRDTIKKLAATRKHRVYVVDSDGKPVGVVSLKDILQALIVNVGVETDWEDAIYMKPDYVMSLGYV